MAVRWGTKGVWGLRISLCLRGGLRLFVRRLRSVCRKLLRAGGRQGVGGCNELFKRLVWAGGKLFLGPGELN
jgi:hypothetical protein